MNKWDRFALLAVCVCYTSSLLLFSMAVLLCPMVIFFVILQMNPFVVSLLQYILLKEKICIFEVAAMVLSFMGVVVLSFRPGSDSSDTSYNYQLGILVSLVSVLSFAITAVALRKLEKIPSSVTSFYLSSATVFVCGIWVVGCFIATNINPF